MGPVRSGGAGGRSREQEVEEARRNENKSEKAGSRASRVAAPCADMRCLVSEAMMSDDGCGAARELADLGVRAREPARGGEPRAAAGIGQLYTAIYYKCEAMRAAVQAPVKLIPPARGGVTVSDDT